MFMSEQYENLDLPSKILASLLSNSAMAFGFQLFLMYEGAGKCLPIFSALILERFLVLGGLSYCISRFFI
jgi:hypothetical protein